MKKFTFPLDRVLDWRRTQARLEEAKLEALHAEAAAIEARQAALEHESSESERSLVATGVITGLELAAGSAFRRFTALEGGRIKAQREDCRRRADAQMQIVAVKRREVRLLERLRTTRLKTWTQELEREIDAEAHESHLAKFARRASTI